MSLTSLVRLSSALGVTIDDLLRGGEDPSAYRVGRRRVRHAEVLVADSEQVEAWRNLGQSEAVLFWIVALPARAAQLPRWG